MVVAKRTLLHGPPKTKTNTSKRRVSPHFRYLNTWKWPEPTPRLAGALRVSRDKTVCLDLFLLNLLRQISNPPQMSTLHVRRVRSCSNFSHDCTRSPYDRRCIDPTIARWRRRCLSMSNCHDQKRFAFPLRQIRGLHIMALCPYCLFCAAPLSFRFSRSFSMSGISFRLTAFRSLAALFRFLRQPGSSFENGQTRLIASSDTRSGFMVVCPNELYGLSDFSASLRRLPDTFFWAARFRHYSCCGNLLAFFYHQTDPRMTCDVIFLGTLSPRLRL
jgi:hypothetical protein